MREIKLITEEQKEIIINERIKGNNVELPKILYKYRPFDKFTYDMLENKYFYLCPAKNLDDPSECTVSFNVQDYMDIHTEQLNALCVFNILQMLKPYTTAENFEQCKNIVANILTADGVVRRDWVLDAFFEMQRLAPSVNIAPFVNWLGNIPEKINEPNVRAQIEKLFLFARNAREETGICSLTQLKDDEAMWNDYADKSSGYCVEYDMTQCECKELLFPVVYKDNRQNNILMTIISDFIGQMIIGMSYGQINADRSKFLKMFLTKDTKWKHQEEWRLIYHANEKLPTPPVKSIYLGKNVKDKDKKQMTSFCEKSKILLV